MNTAPPRSLEADLRNPATGLPVGPLDVRS